MFEEPERPINRYRYDLSRYPSVDQIIRTNEQDVARERLSLPQLPGLHHHVPVSTGIILLHHMYQVGVLYIIYIPGILIPNKNQNDDACTRKTHYLQARRRTQHPDADAKICDFGCIIPGTWYVLIARAKL